MREQQYGKYLLLDRIAAGGMAEITVPALVHERVRSFLRFR